MLSLATIFPCIREYSIRRLPHPGQSIQPRSAFGSDHTGSSPPGVVGSASRMALHPSPATTATPSGAPSGAIANRFCVKLHSAVEL